MGGEGSEGGDDRWRVELRDFEWKPENERTKSNNTNRMLQEDLVAPILRCTVFVLEILQGGFLLSQYSSSSVGYLDRRLFRSSRKKTLIVTA